MFTTEKEENDEDTLNLFNQAEFFFIAKEYEKAAHLYSEILFKNQLKGKEYLNVLKKRGECFFHCNRFEEAKQDFHRLVSEEKTASAYTKLGVAYFALNDDDSILYFDEAIRLDDTFFDAYYGRGKAFLYVDNFREAENDFLKALEIDDQAVSIYQLLLHLYMHLNNIAKAERLIERLNKALPNSLHALAMSGGMEYIRGNFPKAIDLYTKALEVGLDREILSKRASCYLNLHMYDKAMEDANEALNDKFVTGAYLIRAQLYRREGKIDEALDDYVAYFEDNDSTMDNESRYQVLEEIAACKLGIYCREEKIDIPEEKDLGNDEIDFDYQRTLKALSEKLNDPILHQVHSHLTLAKGDGRGRLTPQLATLQRILRHVILLKLDIQKRSSRNKWD